MLASLGEYLELDFAITQFNNNQVDYKIDYETNTLKVNYKGTEDGIIRVSEAIINNFMKKYPNYSSIWSNQCLKL